MKTTIKVEKVSNGFIVAGEETGVKKVTANEEAAAKIVANGFVSVFEQMKECETKIVEFEIK